MLDSILTWLESGRDTDRSFALEWLAQEVPSVPPEVAASLCQAVLRQPPDHLEACLAASALGRLALLEAVEPPG